MPTKTKSSPKKATKNKKTVIEKTKSSPKKATTKKNKKDPTPTKMNQGELESEEMQDVLTEEEEMLIAEKSRQVIADIISAQADQIVFTSGATESINLALLLATQKTSRGRIVISSVEHPATLNATNRFKDQGWHIEEWPVKRHKWIGEAAPLQMKVL